MLYFLVHWFIKITAFIPRLIVFRLKIFYEDKHVQGRHIKGKAIVISNHHTIMDVALYLFVFWTRTLRAVAAEVLYAKNFLMTFLVKAMGCIKVDREAHDFAFLSKAERVLSKGGVVEIYPEARLAKKGEEVPLEFKPSVVYLALSSGAPIIPVYNTGSLFKFTRTYVMIGKPIDVREWYDDSLGEKENIDIICERLRGKVIELKDELARQEKTR